MNSNSSIVTKTSQAGEATKPTNSVRLDLLPGPDGGTVGLAGTGNDSNVLADGIGASQGSGLLSSKPTGLASGLMGQQAMDNEYFTDHNLMSFSNRKAPLVTSKVHETFFQQQQTQQQWIQQQHLKWQQQQAGVYGPPTGVNTGVHGFPGKDSVARKAGVPLPSDTRAGIFGPSAGAGMRTFGVPTGTGAGVRGLSGDGTAAHQLGTKPPGSIGGGVRISGDNDTIFDIPGKKSILQDTRVVCSSDPGTAMEQTVCRMRGMQRICETECLI